MTDKENRPEIFTTPLAGGKPIGVPIPLDEAFGEAVELTAAHFPEVDLGDILEPPKNSNAEIAHWALMLVLDGAGVKPGALAKELRYKSRKSLLAEREVARVAIEEEKSARLRFEIINTKYHRFLRGIVSSAAEQPPAIQEIASANIKPQLEQVPPPSLSRHEYHLLIGFRQGRTGTEDMLVHSYLEPIIDFIEELKPDDPTETLDLAISILKRHAKDFDITSPLSFTETLFKKVSEELAARQRLRNVAENTKNLDVRDYYDEVQLYAANFGNKPIPKAPIDTPTIDSVITNATEYFERRFAKGSEDPVQIFASLASTGKADLAKSIRAIFTGELTKQLKLSARLKGVKLKRCKTEEERRRADFHLAELPVDKQELYYGILLEKVTSEKVTHYSKRPRHTRTNRRNQK